MKGKLSVEPGAYLLLALYLLLLPFPWVGAMLLAGAVHEFGHCLALCYFGAPIGRIRIGPFGAKIETVPMEGCMVFFCALAGPLSGLMLCLFWRWLPRTAFLALCHSIFNLLPIYPLDGGRAIQAAGQWRKR